MDWSLILVNVSSSSSLPEDSDCYCPDPSADTHAARCMVHVLELRQEVKGLFTLLSYEEKRTLRKQKVPLSSLAVMRIGLSCVEQTSLCNCSKCGHYNIAADTAEESAKSVYINRISRFARCADGHYVVDLEFKCIKCEAIRTISKHGPEEGVRVTLPSSLS
jgi:hypothetical protein